jgi:hypothetical protein
MFQSLKDLSIIVDHFDKYPLLTHKFADYQLFKQGFYLISKGEHLTTEGFNTVLAIKASSSRIKVYLMN